ncbi:MAG: hypothetical protein JSV34_06825, partial [Candidatus Omnitrophota bacterium]
NFVNQDFVEKYKSELKKLQGRKRKKIKSMDLGEIISQVSSNIKQNHKFIEVILFFHPQQQVISKIRERFSSAFKDKRIFVFIGSDWNHHSYQAAFGDKDTFFVLLISCRYLVEMPALDKEILKKNVDTLKLIGEATYRTIEDKSILYSLSEV